MNPKDKKIDDDALAALAAADAEESAAKDMEAALAAITEGDELAALPEGEADEEPSPEQSAEALMAPNLEAALAESKDKLLRALAEAENTRRRGAREKEEASKYAITAFARDMLSVADNLHRALDSVDDAARAEDESLDTLMVGVEMTEREMLGAFKRIGITAIDALDKKFDHNFHQAMFEMDDEGCPVGTVIKILQTGYMLHDRLLRPAQVGVSKGGPKADQGAGNQDQDQGADDQDQNQGQDQDQNQARAGAYEKAAEKLGDTSGAGSAIDEEL